MWVIIKSINLFVEVIQTLIIIRIFLSFIMRDLNNPILKIVYQITEPILAPFRGLIGKLNINTGMFDFSPILAILALNILASILIRLLVIL